MSTATIALEHTLDACSENDRQDRLIAAFDTPEIDSCAEIAMLIPDPQVRRLMLLSLAELRRSNTAEGDSERVAAGLLDEAARAGHAHRLQPTNDRLNVRAAANLLRPLLRDDRNQVTGARWALLQAIDDCRRRMDPVHLTGTGMCGELGDGPHRQLLAVIATLS